MKITDQAVLLKDEIVSEVNEFAEESLCVGTLRHKNLIVFDNGLKKWHEIIASYSQPNDDKRWIKQLPSMEGFLLCAGSRMITLVNLKAKTMQPMISDSSQPCYAQPGVIFPESLIDDGN